jgi:hypothetical protein
VVCLGFFVCYSVAFSVESDFGIVFTKFKQKLRRLSGQLV